MIYLTEINIRLGRFGNSSKTKTNGEKFVGEMRVWLRWGKSSDKLVKAWPWIIDNGMASNEQWQDLYAKEFIISFWISIEINSVNCHSLCNGFRNKKNSCNCARTISRQACIQLCKYTNLSNRSSANGKQLNATTIRESRSHVCSWLFNRFIICSSTNSRTFRQTW